MLLRSSGILLLLQLLLLELFQLSLSCLTPLGDYGRPRPVEECEPLMELLLRYKKDVPPKLRTFIRHSRISVENGTHIVCCANFNESEVTGVAILRNMNLICGTYLGRRISFGQETTLLRHPWAVLLIYNTPQRFHCGASLISHRYVLTAAHCVTIRTIELVGVRIGEHNLDTNPDCAPSLTGEQLCVAPFQDVDIEKRIVHQDYDKEAIDHDIALLRIKQLKFLQSVVPVCLPAIGREYSDDKGWIIGWGTTENKPRSHILMEASVPILPIDRCQSVYRNHEGLWEKKLCAAGNNESDTCRGDSGGPLLVQTYLSSRYRFLQVGVISSGISKCGDKRFYPSVFTHVQTYMDWIIENLEV